MNTLKIKNKNYSVMHIGCDFGIANELSEFFSFFVPGYKFMPAYKNRVWDGKIRLFNINTMELPVGLFPFLKEFCKPRGYTVEVEHNNYYGRPDAQVDINPGEIKEFIDKLELTSRGKSIEIRDYQFDAVCEGLHRKRAVLISPTGSGKSLIIYALVQRYLLKHRRKDRKVLIIVPTTSLVEQMYNDFADYGMPVEDCVHRIYSGRDKETEKEIVISTWQSIYKLPPKWFEDFGAVVGDECHGFKSKSLTTIMNKCKEAEYRWGTTGTLDGSQTHELVLQGLFGKIYNVTTTKKLQDEDTLAKLKIKVLLLKHPLEVRQNWGKQDYQAELDYIVRNESRNKLITNLALDLNGNSLVLFNFVEKHGKPLFDLIRDKAHENRKVFFVSGETDTSDREAIRKIVEGQKNAIIVASLGTFSTGINIRNLHNIIFASPSKSQIRVLQSIGRGLRKSDDGETAALYDIADDLHWKGRKNYTLEHSAERVKMYVKQEFNYKIYEVDLK
jgi:superfamily II DNA or RNA helicase